MASTFSTTENGATAFESTGSATMDLFVKGVRNCPIDFVHEKLGLAWIEDAARTTRLICQTRDPRDGKGERDLTFEMLFWLHSHKPLTYKMNIKKIAQDYGRFEDLLEMNCRTDSIELQLIADQLKEDMESEHPSLAAKWSATEGGHYSRQQKKIARLLFPKDTQTASGVLPYAPDKKYRKECLVPLREKLHIIETKMCSGKWTEINFEHTPAQAMRIYGRDSVAKYGTEPKEMQEGAFMRHCPTEFKEYRQAVKEGKAEIKTTGIQPHQLVGPYVRDGALDETVELQWTALVEKLRQTGTANSSIGSSMAIVDVSGSMNGEPMEVAIALGLIISELAQEPFKNKIITFHETPSIIDIPAGSLHNRVNILKQSPWGGSTNFEASLDLILTMAKLCMVLPENMVKTLFIFTDMQFNMAHHQTKHHAASSLPGRPSSWLIQDVDSDDEKETKNTSALKSEDILYNIAKAKYEAAGYQLPKIVFWNLRASEKNAFPVECSSQGIAFVSGFSSDLLKVFLQGIDFEPLNILTQLLSKYEVQIHPNEL
jgi:hypothetical protein